MIAFVGSVFSPYYAWSGRGDPLNHCAVNVAVYGRSGNRWAMTERGRSALERSSTRFRLGPSSLSWQDGALVVELDERGAPIPRAIRGAIRIVPEVLPASSFTLDAAGRHVWQPIAPRARVTVALARPELGWSGSGYLDSNFGSEPLEAGFRDWSWSRAHGESGTTVFYDAVRRDGSDACLALRFGDDGRVHSLPPLAAAALPTTGWRLSRRTRADTADGATLVSTLESSPFYARSLVEARLYGEPVLAMHESLSLERFRSPVVQAMLTCRMPRRGR